MKLKSFFLILSIGLGFFAQAQRGIDLPGGDTTKLTGTTYAIIIGLSKYNEVPSLQFAHKDAQAFEDFLLSEAGGKVPRTL